MTLTPQPPFLCPSPPALAAPAARRGMGGRGLPTALRARMAGCMLPCRRQPGPGTALIPDWKPLGRNYATSSRQISKLQLIYAAAPAYMSGGAFLHAAESAAAACGCRTRRAVANACLMAVCAGWGFAGGFLPDGCCVGWCACGLCKNSCPRHVQLGGGDMLAHAAKSQRKAANGPYSGAAAGGGHAPVIW